ncbi:hypothetical protein [Bacillus sp. CHD6a]|uniref:hypothetical protein n=1 Tax=Bacillus sp. CHD6a TaxID=1643452 RepID=UPI0006CD8CA4|nr:hypothetical protein [Bacillus sp. CHD6a]KPB03423.1 hypothetical protein AAV98_17125 [Bacillus sp. CHD6a]
MSIEIILIPVAIAVTQAVASELVQQTSRSIYILPTIMKDSVLLQQALDNYGCQTTSIDYDHLSYKIGDIQIIFQYSENQTFEAVFKKDIPREAAEEFVERLHEEYTSLVQQKTYKMLVERAKEKGLILETEHVNKQNSIVLSFQVASSGE